MDDELLNYLNEKNFYGAYETAMRGYSLNPTIEDFSDLAQKLLVIGWFEMSINGGGIDSFLYSETANHLDILIDVSKEVEATYVLDAINSFSKILPDEIIPKDLEKRFTAIDIARNKLGDEYWSLMEKIDKPVLFEERDTISKLFTEFISKKS